MTFPNLLLPRDLPTATGGLILPSRGLVTGPFATRDFTGLSGEGADAETNGKLFAKSRLQSIRGSIDLRKRGAVAAARRRGGGVTPAWYDNAITSNNNWYSTFGGGAGVFAAKITCGQSGTVKKVRLYINFVNASTTTKVGLYDSSGSLLSSGSRTITNDGNYKYYEITITDQSVSVANYYVAYSCSGTGLDLPFLTGQPSGICKIQYAPPGYADMPISDLSELFDYTYAMMIGMYVE